MSCLLSKDYFKITLYLRVVNFWIGFESDHKLCFFSSIFEFVHFFICIVKFQNLWEHYIPIRTNNLPSEMIPSWEISRFNEISWGSFVPCLRIHKIFFPLSQISGLKSAVLDHTPSLWNVIRVLPLKDFHT